MNAALQPNEIFVLVVAKTISRLLTCRAFIKAKARYPQCLFSCLHRVECHPVLPVIMFNKVRKRLHQLANLK